MSAASLKWLDDYLAAFNITQEVGPSMAYDAKRNYYVTFGIGGEQAEGDGAVYASSERNAERLYWQALKAYLDAHQYRHIVWRTRPQVESRNFKPLGGIASASPITLWSVFSRLTGYMCAEHAI